MTELETIPLRALAAIAGGDGEHKCRDAVIGSMLPGGLLGTIIGGLHGTRAYSAKGFLKIFGGWTAGGAAATGVLNSPGIAKACF